MINKKLFAVEEAMNKIKENLSHELFNDVHQRNRKTDLSRKSSENTNYWGAGSKVLVVLFYLIQY